MRTEFTFHADDRPQVWANGVTGSRWIVIESFAHNVSVNMFFKEGADGDEQIKTLISKLEALLPAPAEPVLELSPDQLVAAPVTAD